MVRPEGEFMSVSGQPKAGEMVAKANTLVHAAYNMTRQEKLMMWWIIWQYQKTRTNRLTIKCQEVAEFAGAAHGQLYIETLKTARSLRMREIALWKPEKNRTGYSGFLSYAEYGNDRSGEIDVIVTEQLLPYIDKFIEDMRIGFTKFEMVVIASLKTFHGLRLYEVAKSVNYGEHKKTGWECSVEELRKRFGCLVVDDKGVIKNDEYKEWRRFKEDVLDKAVRDVNLASDMHVSYVLRKAGRSVVGVRLMVKVNGSGAAVMHAQGADRGFAEAMAKIGVSGKTIRDLLETYGKSDPERLTFALKNVATVVKDGKAKNPAAWFVAAVKRDDRVQGSLMFDDATRARERRLELAEIEADRKKRMGRPQAETTKGPQAIGSLLGAAAKSASGSEVDPEARKRIGEMMAAHAETMRKKAALAD